MLKEVRHSIAVVFIALLSQNTFATGSPSLPALGALPDQTSISGLSSGAFMAAQFHVAYSKDLVGVGIVAGGPWNCAASNPAVPPIKNAVSTCMDPCKYSWFGCSSDLFPNSGYLADLANATASQGYIDNPHNLHDDQVYLFSGKNDKTVMTGVVDTARDFYHKLGLKDDQILYNSQVNAGHAFVTADPDHTPCSETEAPYINACDIPQAQRILKHIYGEMQPAVETPSGDLVRFNQREFFSTDMTSMDDDAYVYIPQNCRTEQCRVHVALHGCRQGISVIGKTYIEQTGYMEAADNNNIVVLYPQVKKSSNNPMNPRGCWDFWGYSTNNLPPYTYFRKDAPQMKAIKSMIDRLSSLPAQLRPQQ